MFTRLHATRGCTTSPPLPRRSLPLGRADEACARAKRDAKGRKKCDGVAPRRAALPCAHGVASVLWRERERVRGRENDWSGRVEKEGRAQGWLRRDGVGREAAEGKGLNEERDAVLSGASQRADAHHRRFSRSPRLARSLSSFSFCLSISPSLPRFLSVSVSSSPRFSFSYPLCLSLSPTHPHSPISVHGPSVLASVSSGSSERASLARSPVTGSVQSFPSPLSIPLLTIPLPLSSHVPFPSL